MVHKPIPIKIKKTFTTGCILCVLFFLHISVWLVGLMFASATVRTMRQRTLGASKNVGI